MTTTVAPSRAEAAEPRPSARPGVAAALVVVGLVAITAWWTTWAASRSILAETRSPAIGEALVDDPAVRDDVSRQVYDGMLGSGVTSLGFTDDDLRAAADDVAADPAVAPNIAERVADAHRAALRSPDTHRFPSPYDDQPFVDASIRALEARRPDLAIPDLQWLFSTSVGDEFPDLHGPATTADRWQLPSFALAVVAFVGSAALHPDRRPRRWLARWCLVTGALTLAAPIVVRFLDGALAGERGAVVRAVAGSLDGGAPRRGALLLISIGALLSLGTWARNRRTSGPPPPPAPRQPARMPSGPVRLGTRPVPEPTRVEVRRPA